MSEIKATENFYYYGTCCMHWQLMRMRVHREKKKEDLGKKSMSFPSIEPVTS